MPTKLRLTLNTLRSNVRLTQWPVTALDPLDDYDRFVEQAYKEKTAIDTNDHLASKGKRAAKDERTAALVKAVVDKHAPRLSGLEADMSTRRATLLQTNTEKPDARRIDLLLSHLRGFTAQEIAIFYGSATDDEKIVLEEAARSVGRIPTKTEAGLVWAPLLPAETINDAVIARAAAKNPEGAKQLQELSEIRDMHATVSALAIAEIKDVLSR